jgi:DNA-binding MarR family transcriptional regulator
MSDKSSVGQLGRRIKMLSVLADKRLNNNLDSLGIGLTSNQVAVMMALHEKQHDEVTQKQIETFLRLSHPTTRGIIKRLDSNGLITTAVSPGDRRQVVLSLTKLGQDFLEKNINRIEDQLDGVEKQLTTGISSSEQELFQTILVKMIKNLQ